jgi:HSP20 family protein
MDTKLAKTEPKGVKLFENTFGFPMFRRLSEELDELFDRFGQDRPFFEPRRWTRGEWTPDVEMFERGGELVIRADVPGMRKEDITIETTEDEITFRGERKEEKEEKREGFYRAERTYGSFYRALPLPEGAKIDLAKAVVKDGVLEVTMPMLKVEEKKRRLEIQEPAEPDKATKHAA